MENQKILDTYLLQMEKSLSDLSPSDRSSIILDIQKHIEESQNKFPDKTVADILKDLGSAQKLANHYRLDRGLKTFKPAKNPILKWLSITFLGSFAIIAITVIVLVFKFSPVFSVDEKNDRIVILGGLIDINGVSGKVTFMDQTQFVGRNKFTNQFNGSLDMPSSEFDELVVNFKSGVLNFKPSLGRKLSWDCKMERPPNNDFINTSKDIIEIDLEEYEGVSCDIEVPTEIKLTVDGKDAQITVLDPEYDLYIDIESGQVFFNPNPEFDYKYDLKASNGTMDAYESSTAPNAFEVNIVIENGSILKGQP